LSSDLKIEKIRRLIGPVTEGQLGVGGALVRRQRRTTLARSVPSPLPAMSTGRAVPSRFQVVGRGVGSVAAVDAVRTRLQVVVAVGGGGGLTGGRTAGKGGVTAGLGQVEGLGRSPDLGVAEANGIAPDDAVVDVLRTACIEAAAVPSTWIPPPLPPLPMPAVLPVTRL